MEIFYAYSDDGKTQGYYYLNNFDNIFISGGMYLLLIMLIIHLYQVVFIKGQQHSEIYITMNVWYALFHSQVTKEKKKKNK